MFTFSRSKPICSGSSIRNKQINRKKKSLHAVCIYLTKHFQDLKGRLCVCCESGVHPTWPQALVWLPDWQGLGRPSPTLVSRGPRARRSRPGRAEPSPAASWPWWSRYGTPEERRGQREERRRMGRVWSESNSYTHKSVLRGKFNLEAAF